MASPLPDPLPADPLPLLADWLAEAAAAVRNPTAMTLATVDEAGRPRARMVLCRAFEASRGSLVFYTDRGSPKARDLTGTAHAALVFYWEPLERQARVEGPVTSVDEAEVDAYWRTRPRPAQVAAAASVQSRPLASRQRLLEQMAAVSSAHGEAVPRPPRWGGFRVWAERVELWVGQPGRAHDRAAWVRSLSAADAVHRAAWTATRLEP